MSHHFLHGSVKEIYRTLANDIPQTWSQVIPAGTEALLAYGSHGDPDHYSLVPLKTKEGTKLLFSRCSRKRNAKSPSYYVHKQLLDVDMNTLHSGFDLLLETPFCSEGEFDRVAEDQGRRMQPDIRWTGGEITIAPAILYGILRAMISRWRNGSDPVIVRVPEMSAEDYNAYTFAAVRTIYSCLPAGIRGKVGFMTYSSPVKQLNSIGLFFLPENQTSKGVYLDQEENDQSRQLMNGYLDESMEQMIRSIAYDPDHRRERLQDLWELAESGMTLENIHESHYTSCLKYAQLLDLKIENPDQRKQLLDLFVNHENIPEPLGSKLLVKLISRIMPQDLDNYILNRREEDRSFREYLTRVQEWGHLCACSEKLKEHTAQHIREVFEAFLSGITDEKALTDLEEQLTALANDPPAIFPDVHIDLCAQKWADHSMPIYKAKIVRTLEEIEQRLTEIVNQKTQLHTDLKQIIKNDPRNISIELLHLQSNMYAEIKKLPKRFLETQTNFQVVYEDQLKEMIGNKVKELADKYLDAAKQELGKVLMPIDSELCNRVASLRSDLEKLMNELHSYETVSPKKMIDQFDRYTADQKKKLADGLLKKAHRDLDDLSSDGETNSLYNEVARLKHDLRTELQNLDVEKADEWSMSFCNRANGNFYDLLKFRCRKREVNKDDETELNAEIKRLEDLSSFLSVHYPKDKKLREEVTIFLRTLRNARQSKTKARTAPAPKKKPASVYIPAQKDTKQAAQYGSHPYTPPSQAGAEEEPDILGGLDTPTQIVEVRGKTLEQIYRELCSAKDSTQSITFTDTAGVTSFATTHTKAELKDILEWLMSPHIKAVPKNCDALLADLLQEHFSTAALMPREKISVLAALTKDQRYCELGQSWVERMIGYPQDWNDDKNNQREIRRLLINHPEYAKSCPSWKQRTGLAGIKDFLAGVRGGSSAIAEHPTKADFPVEAQKKLDWRMFLIGFCTGAIVVMILWSYYRKPVPGPIPPETTAPIQTEAAEVGGESKPAEAGEEEIGTNETDDEVSMDPNAEDAPADSSNDVVTDELDPDINQGDNSEEENNVTPGADSDQEGISDDQSSTDADGNGENTSDGGDDTDTSGEDTHGNTPPYNGGYTSTIPPTPVG